MVSAAMFQGCPLCQDLYCKRNLCSCFSSIYPANDEGSFKASSGLLHKFCAQHGVRKLSVQGESLSADTSSVDTFCTELCSKVENEGYTLSQVFNADETDLWWRLMPSKSLVQCGEKNYKNHRTVLGCANAFGTCKLPLFLSTRVLNHAASNTWIWALYLCTILHRRSPEWMPKFLKSGFIRSLCHMSRSFV